MKQIAPHKPLVKVKRILAPTDFSPGAAEATEWAMTLGTAFGAEVTLLHVLELSTAAAAGLPTQVAAMPLMEQLRSESKMEIDKLTVRFPSAKTILREGTPRSAILEVATEIGANLIVMGTHGRIGLAHVFFGSVAEYVVRHSRVPVLTVRQQEE